MKQQINFFYIPLIFIMSGWFDEAQICENGHIINSRMKSLPQWNQKYCQKCGSPTIDKCSVCKKPIRGMYIFSGGVYLSPEYEKPNYCLNCGQAYPWTEIKIAAAKELVDTLNQLDTAEREELKSTFDDIGKDTPKAEVSAYKIKKILAKVGGEAGEIIRGMIVEIASEAIKKIIFPT